MMNIDVENTLNRIRKVTANQHLGVLATTAESRPYLSLMVFMISEDLSRITLVTRRNTRKYREMVDSPRVAFLIDTRSHADTFFTATAVITAEGIATEAAAGEYPALQASFISQHEHMAEFVTAEDTAFLFVNVAKYDVVTDFENVKSLDVDNSDEGITYSVELKANY